MTIAIAIAVPDGIALAADTQTTWTRTILKAKQKGNKEEFELDEPITVPIGWSKMTRKLFPLKFNQNHFAICHAGTAILNSKTIYAIFKSLEKSYEGDSNFNGIVEYLVEGIKEQLRLQYKSDELSKVETNIIHFIIVGYENQDVSKPLIETHWVFSGVMKHDGINDSSGHVKVVKNGVYGGNWIGKTEFITHIVNHNNDSLPLISGQYELMSLSDAVDYTKFLVEFTCDFQRFAVMVPDCGRPIISATLTPEGYNEEII